MHANRTLILALDQGTHASKALLFDAAGRALMRCERPIGLRRLDAQCVEQDAEEILRATQAVLEEAIAYATQAGAHITAAGLATQRSTVVAWDRASGAPLAPALSWQDTRAQDFIRSLDPLAAEISERTGLRLSAHYGASKLRWLLRHQPAVQEALQAGRLCVGPLSSFLLFRLLEEQPYCVDEANAGRTLLFNLRTRAWDPWLQERFELSDLALPECVPVRAEHGRLALGKIALRAVNGDQGAALMGSAGSGQGTLVNLGTGAFVLSPSREKRAHTPALLQSLIDSDTHAAHFALEGTVNGAGAALDWFQAQCPDAPALTEFAWPDAAPPVFVNTVGGLGSPWWRPGPAPHFLDENGVPQDLNLQQAGVVESILFLVKANLEAMRAAGASSTSVLLSGGLSQLHGLAQRLADLLNLPVECSLEPEATGRGIAWLAAGKPGGWSPAETIRYAPRQDPALQERFLRLTAALASCG